MMASILLQINLAWTALKFKLNLWELAVARYALDQSVFKENIICMFLILSIQSLFLQIGGSNLSREDIPEKLVRDIVAFFNYVITVYNIDHVIIGQLLPRYSERSGSNYNDKVYIRIFYGRWSLNHYVRIFFINIYYKLLLVTSGPNLNVLIMVIFHLPVFPIFAARVSTSKNSKEL